MSDEITNSAITDDTILDDEGPTVAEMGRRGGCKTSERHGVDHYRNMGRKGGLTTSERHGAEHYRRMGTKGGQSNSARHGREHYQRIGRLGGRRAAELIELGRAVEARETPEPADE